MKDAKKFPIPNQASMGGEVGIRTDINSEHPYSSIDHYAGDSVDEYRQIEAANEHIADKEIAQITENS
ncbi:hypothetical protein LC040_14035 [Bacillus tianshenii]|nr:hypothetical protein LC040_14035 [Bacillus tianshenii]